MPIKFEFPADAFEKAFGDVSAPLAEAATESITEVSQKMVKVGRANIASAGLGPRWQGALRARVYPQGGKPSLKAAAFIYHKIPYAEVFEQGATIRGKPLLWLPTKNNTTHKRPKEFGDQLFSINHPGRRPLLALKQGKKTVPMFVGIDTVSIRKRISLYDVFEQEAQELPAIFESKLKG